MPKDLPKKFEQVQELPVTQQWPGIVIRVPFLNKVPGVQIAKGDLVFRELHAALDH